MSIEIRTGYGDPFSFDTTDEALDFIKSVVRANKGKIEVLWGPRVVPVPPAPLSAYDYVDKPDGAMPEEPQI